MLWLLLIAIPLLLAALLAGSGLMMANRFMRPWTWSHDKALNYCLERGDFSREELQQAEFEPWQLQSPLGYRLSGVRFGAAGSNRAVLLCHGHGVCWPSMLKYGLFFARLGFRVFAYDHRYHGESGGSFCSAGYYEKQDLASVVKTIRGEHSDISVLGVMGESMGAATVLQYLEQAEGVDFAVADCPYAGMEEQYRHLLTRIGLPRFLHRPLLLCCDYRLKRAGGFSMDGVQPREACAESPVPVAFIHGGEDRYVPAVMTRRISQNRRYRSKDRLLIVPGARHGLSFNRDPEGYQRFLIDFLHSLDVET